LAAQIESQAVLGHFSGCATQSGRLETLAVCDSFRFMQNISVQIIRFVDSSFPGRVECELVDADGKRHVIRDKVPIFTAETLDAKSLYPAAGSMQCEVVQRFQDGVGRGLVRVSTERLGVESVDGVTQFTVDANLVSMLPG
jgi:hypothetical protein